MGAEEMIKGSITKHPYAAIEHRVIDSPAYADLSFSGRSLLVLIARQLSKDNNGHLQSTFSYIRRFGLSENTLSRAIRELISHGMIYRTRSGGYQQGAAQYAVTWLSIKNKKGIFLDGYVHCAWRYWIPEEKKIDPPKLRSIRLKRSKLISTTTPKIDADPPPKSKDIELIPCRGTSLWYPKYKINVPKSINLTRSSR